MEMLEEVKRKTFIRNFRPERRYAVLGKNANITQQTKVKGNRKWAREFSEVMSVKCEKTFSFFFYFKAFHNSRSFCSIVPLSESWLLPIHTS